MSAALTFYQQEDSEGSEEEATLDAAPAQRPVITNAAAFTTTGRILGFVPALGPLVDFPANPAGVLLLARSVVPITGTSVGCEVALSFENSDLTRPLILGVLQDFADAAASFPRAGSPLEVTVDENRLLLTAKEEIVLRCGRASITLTAAGKVLIRGEYVLSRSTGPNRIKGGSVQIN